LDKRIETHIQSSEKPLREIERFNRSNKKYNNDLRTFTYEIVYLFPKTLLLLIRNNQEFSLRHQVLAFLVQDQIAYKSF